MRRCRRRPEGQWVGGSVLDPAGLPCRVRTLLVILLVLAAVAVAGDRVAEHLVTSGAERRLAENGVTDPQVDVAGFPFLTQLVGHRFGDVTLTGSAAEVDGNRVSGIRVRARQVELPSGADATASALHASLLVPYDEVLERAGRQELEMSPAGNGRVRLRGEVDVLGRSVEVVGVGRVRVAGSRLRVRPQSFRLADGGAVDATLDGLLVDRFTVSYPLRPALPDGVTVRRATPAADGFRVTLAGRDVSFDPSTVR